MQSLDPATKCVECGYRTIHGLDTTTVFLSHVSLVCCTSWETYPDQNVLNIELLIVNPAAVIFAQDYDQYPYAAMSLYSIISDKVIDIHYACILYHLSHWWCYRSLKYSIQSTHYMLAHYMLTDSLQSLDCLPMCALCWGNPRIVGRSIICLLP